MEKNTAAWARAVAQDLLETALPRRWSHTQGVVRQARTIAPILGKHADLIEAAAWLHDIGYATVLHQTGFHPLDGARHLRDAHHADAILCRLVANHSCALIEAEQRGLSRQLITQFPQVDEFLADALIFCDMTTTPDGQQVAVETRLAEIRIRYGPTDIVTKFVNLAEARLVEAVRRVHFRQ